MTRPWKVFTDDEVFAVLLGSVKPLGAGQVGRELTGSVRGGGSPLKGVVASLARLEAAGRVKRIRWSAGTGYVVSGAAPPKRYSIESLVDGKPYRVRVHDRVQAIRVFLATAVARPHHDVKMKSGGIVYARVRFSDMP